MTLNEKLDGILSLLNKGELGFNPVYNASGSSSTPFNSYVFADDSYYLIIGGGIYNSGSACTLTLTTECEYKQITKGSSLLVAYIIKGQQGKTLSYTVSAGGSAVRGVEIIQVTGI